VSDSGSGIDPATQSRIFEPFFSTKSVGEGTGLGLAIVHGIVRAHEGTIELRSEPGSGTTFDIYFPALQGAKQEIQPPATSEATGQSPRGPCHVLFVDDSDALVSVMVRSLSRRGYRVSGYSSPADALRALRDVSHACDVVVTDYIMPGTSGLDFAREVAALRPGLPVVLFSGHIDDELRRKARESGVRQLMGKLGAADELTEAIERLTAAPRPDAPR
jgi:CheY-like chemotaxis protein